MIVTHSAVEELVNFAYPRFFSISRFTSLSETKSAVQPPLLLAFTGVRQFDKVLLLCLCVCQVSLPIFVVVNGDTCLLDGDTLYLLCLLRAGFWTKSSIPLLFLCQVASILVGIATIKVMIDNIC